MLSAFGSMLGMFLSLPGMIGLTGSILDFYSILDLIMLILVAASTTIVFVSVLSVISALSKSVKEASTYAVPLMLLCFVSGISSTLFDNTQIQVYLIPVINSALSVSSILSFDISLANMAVTVATNITFALICTLTLSKIFSSEKIVFGN